MPVVGGKNQPILVIKLKVKAIVLVDTLGLAINPIACCCRVIADDFAHTSGKSNTDFESFTHVK